MRLSTRARLSAARAGITLGLGGGELERLFRATARAFGASVPARRAPGLAARLREYASFTRRHAEAALARAGGASRSASGGASGRTQAEAVGPQAEAVEGRLFQAGRELGQGYRARLGVRSLEEAMAAARVVYGGIGIDFRGGADGKVVIHRCRFASIYSPGVCRVISAMDRGLLSGLADGGELHFCQRLTEGAPSCTATFEGAGS